MEKDVQRVVGCGQVVGAESILGFVGGLAE